MWQFVVLGLIALPCVVFWAITMADCSVDETGEQRIAWMLVIFFGGFVGALIYRAVRYSRRRLQSTPPRLN